MPNVPDWRHLTNGFEIPTINYSDQPYIVKTGDGAWLCALTTGAGHEGQPGQTIAVMRSNDMGRTWSAPIHLEPTDGPEAAYAVLLKTPTGRIYAFYNYNIDNIREVIADDPPWKDGRFFRVDSLGAFVYRYSDDHGRTWSAQRHRIPIRNFQMDLDNPYGGKIQFFWNVGKPVVCNGSVLVSIHKIGRYGVGSFALSEGAFVASDNLLTETDPARIRWETLPEGLIGLRAPEDGGPVAEEQSTVALSDGTLYCIYRTTDGSPTVARSFDGGRNWTAPEYLAFADGRPVKHPRAANFVWKCNNGKYLYWFHNHGGPFIRLHDPTGFENRNPVWVCGGIETQTPRGRTILWSEPEILLYDDDPCIRISYPDCIEDDGRTFITETQKDLARTHEIPQTFLETLWGQPRRRKIARDGIVLELPRRRAAMPTETPAPPIPRFSARDSKHVDNRRKDLRSGFSLDLILMPTSVRPGQTLLDATTTDGRGWRLATAPRGAVVFFMSDGQTAAIAESQPGILRTGQPLHLTVIIDGGPKIISFVADGRFLDGGRDRQFGWQRFSASILTVAWAQTLRIAPAVTLLRVYNRPIMTTEAVGNHRAS